MTTGLLVVLVFGALLYGIARAPKEATQVLLAVAWAGMAVMAIGSVVSCAVAFAK